MANRVPNPVQRLRYFDGEYLRSYDFTDEQSYHIEMRRLMNRELHLYGIVHGLEIVQDADSVPATNTYFFSIKHGIAIDQLGREIVVAAPYSLTNVLTQPGLAAGNWYEVWICYQESATGLPAAGYVDCNVTNQNTRLQEGFQVQLIPTQGQSVVTPCTGVRLGVIPLIVSPSGFGYAIQGPVVSPQIYNVKRHYVGIRAQSVKAPDQVDASPDPFSLTDMPPATSPQQLPGYLEVHPGVSNRGNVIVEKNLVVGDDFKLDNKTYTNLPPDFTKIPTGNAKITTDLFVNGDSYFYSTDDATWYSHKQYIQSVMPKILVGPPITIPFTPIPDTGPPSQPGASGSQASNQFPVPPTGTGTVMLAITEMDWQDPTTLGSWGAQPITISVSSGAVNAGPPGFATVTAQWSVGPVVSVAGNWLYPVTKLVVSFVVIFQP